MVIAVSACLLGQNCKYNGGNNFSEELSHRLRGHTVIPICPEVMGGLPTPRTPVELVNGKAIMRSGEDVDACFRKGAQIALKKVTDAGAELVILQPRSPSCGSREIYDGTFSGRKIPGQGIFAALAVRAGLRVLDAEEFLKNPDF